ncbi:amino-acid N-acetyltransferase [Thiohalocapsa marina]|uniref:Amino-acid acetyltransferase n=1 Tax=Thiohalocapsa marina TaxID=424902 RepID=A0A5M8FVB7_9GAMM|nr:amino-acid N-acetyltransferase [Thiohalocapsa marina]KAA6187735.1 amino-acid N-acetyltransferase [Thiohalocapsa marina]
MPTPTSDAFVDWFRQCTPYIHAHRGRTFVIAFGGEALADNSLPTLIHDIALLHGLGIRLVLVHGARPQIEQRLAARGAEMRYVNGIRVTDDAALECVKDAAGSARVEIEALLSMGLANSPMAGVRIPVASGNFVTARPLGVLDGIDYQHTGTVRRIDRQSLRQRLDNGAVALMPPIGYSPTGEVFNLSAADIARAAAIALGADKLIYLTEAAGVTDRDGQLLSNLLAGDVDALLDGEPRPGEDLAQALRAGADACRGGIRRVHLIGRRDDGALLRELFTRDGAGTLISDRPFEELRPARIDDIPGIHELLRPLEQCGALVPRPREHLETTIDRFQVTERDGTIISCAALFCFPDERMAELACLAVHPDYRQHGRGDRLLARMESLARERGLQRIFVLTTQTAHWFRERGFKPAGLNDLPLGKQRLYNLKRNSQVYIKPLGQG